MKASKDYISHLLHRLSHEEDEKAFEALFKVFYESLINFSLNYVLSRELAEEVISDVFVKVWNNRKELATIANLETYLYVAVKNQSLNYLSKLSGYVVSPAGDLFLDNLQDSFDPEKELEFRELQLDLDKAVEGLPAQCRVVFKLIKEDGFKYKEVAEILGLSVRTIETQLTRALKKLSVALVPYLPSRKNKRGPGLLSLILLLPFSFFL